MYRLHETNAYLTIAVFQIDIKNIIYYVSKIKI